MAGTGVSRLKINMMYLDSLKQNMHYFLKENDPDFTSTKDHVHPITNEVKKSAKLLLRDEGQLGLHSRKTLKLYIKVVRSILDYVSSIIFMP